MKNRINKRYLTPDVNTGKVKYSYAEAPYNVTFALYAMVRNMDDGFQIAEQILPYFNPEFTIALNFTDIFQKIDVPIVLNDVTLAEDYDGDFDTRRNVLLTFDFTAKTYVYGPEKTATVISDTKVRTWDYDLGNSGALNFYESGVSGTINGVTAGQTYDVYSNTYTLGKYGVTGSIDTYGNYIGPTFET